MGFSLHTTVGSQLPIPGSVWLFGFAQTLALRVPLKTLELKTVTVNQRPEVSKQTLHCLQKAAAAFQVLSMV